MTLPDAGQLVPPPPRWGWLAAVGVTIVGLIAAAGFWWERANDPQQLLGRAAELTHRDPARAEALLRQAIERAAGRFPDAETRLVLLLARRGDWEGAAELFNELDPAALPLEFLDEFAKLSHAAGRVELAALAWSEIRRRNIPASVQALEGLWGLARDRKDQPAMLEALEELAQLEPRRSERWMRWLSLLEQRRLGAETLRVLRLAVQQELPEPDRRELRHRLVAQLVEAGHIADARRELDDLLRNEGESPRVRVHQAALDRLEGKPQEALDRLQRTLEETGPRPPLIHLRALIYMDLGKYAEAAADFRAGVEADPFDLVSHFKLAEAYRQLNQLDLARQHEELAQGIRQKRQQVHRLREAVKRQPGNPKLYEQLAELHRELNDAEGALRWEALARDPTRGEPPP
ncbi:MAG: tetratricopeptide repeat protein [Planctomycetales bacterium]